MRFGISYMIKFFMMTKKINREEVYNKYEGHCGYCGKEITIKQMQVDHIKPLYRNDKVTTLEVWGVERGSDNFDNLMPSCARCNRWKSTFSLEMFRKEIERQIERLNKYNNNYRMAKDFGLIQETIIPIVFYFEKNSNL
jgi:5-methylcytosine-specific restriction endonuclease McrA